MGSEAKDIRERLATIRVAVEVTKAITRWPSGAPGGKGGQFAPSQSGGYGGKSSGKPMPGWQGGATGKFSAPQYGSGGYGGSYSSGYSSKPYTPPPPPPGAKPHPRTDDKGKPVTVNYPSKPTHESSWTDKTKSAVFVPNGAAPAKLNNIPMKSWSPGPNGFKGVAGTNEALEDGNPFEPTPGKKVGAGVMIVEPDGRVWLTKPTNAFGGYQNTFPKGTVESGLTMQENAIKEAWEETGLKVQITGILGDFERDTSKARFYMARRVGGTPKEMGWESQALVLATPQGAMKLLNRTHDRDIFQTMLDEIEIGKAAKPAKSGAWQQQARWPSGSPLGGQWKEMGSDGLTMPPKIAGGLEGANPAYQKKANAMYAAAQAKNNNAITAAVESLAPSFEKWLANSKQAGSAGKLTSHVSWNAKLYQYGMQLLMVDSVNASKAATAAVRVSGPQKLSDLGPKTGNKPGGSNPGGIHTDSNGEKWLVKGNNAYTNGFATLKESDQRAKNEVLAAKLMLATYTGAPEMKVVNLQGTYQSDANGLGVASKWIGSTKELNPDNPAHAAAVQKTFAVHAWLANYDVLGMGFDNTKIGPDGNAINIDTGGALLFRAQGKPKGAEHGVGKDGLLDPTAPEFHSMQGTTSEQKKLFGSMTQDQIQESAKQLQNITDATIKDLCKTYGPGDEAFNAKLAENLIARRDSILFKAGLTEKTMKAGVSLVPPAAANEDRAATTGAAAGITGLTYFAVYEAKEKAVFASDPSEWPDLQTAEYMIKTFDNATDEAKAKMWAHQTETAKKWGVDVDAIVQGIAGKSPQPDYVQQANANAAQQKPTIHELPPEPVFNSGFDSDKYYKKVVAGVSGAFIQALDAGPEQALSVFEEKLKPYLKYTNGDEKVPYAKATGINGKKMATYFHGTKDLLVKWQQTAQALTAQAADVAISTPAPPPPPKPGFNLPDFDSWKLPATNSNAASHNKKVDEIAALAKAGNVKGLLAMGYGTNTYGKKQAMLANSSLNLMGSRHSVVAGQKAGHHPALTGMVGGPAAAAASASTGIAPPKVAESIKKPVDITNLDLSKTTLPEPPNFSASSKAYINAQNNEMAAKIKAMAMTGNLPALENMTYQTIDKATGALGAHQPVTMHPSKPLQEYHSYLVQTLREVAYPPEPLKAFSVTNAASIADIAAAFPSKKIGTTADKVPKNEQCGFWIALGKVSEVTPVTPSKQRTITPAEVKAASVKHQKAGALALQFMSGIQASGSYANAWRQGKKTDAYGNDVKTVTQAALEHATEHEAGFTVFRFQQMTPSMVDALEKLGKGGVLQATGPMPTSYQDGATSGFGQHKFEIVYAPGAKAVESFASGSFKSEKEITTLPNARFVILDFQKKGYGQGSYTKMLMLPPDVGL